MGQWCSLNGKILGMLRSSAPFIKQRGNKGCEEEEWSKYSKTNKCVWISSYALVGFILIMNHQYMVMIYLKIQKEDNVPCDKYVHIQLTCYASQTVSKNGCFAVHRGSHWKEHRYHPGLTGAPMKYCRKSFIHSFIYFHSVDPYRVK